MDDYRLDNGDGFGEVTDADLLAAADELRHQADAAPTIEQRIAILEAAERFERLAAGLPFKHGETG
jgi:hypothetical protein